MALFDAYIMVDGSSISMLERGSVASAIETPEELADRLSDLTARGRTALVGFANDGGLCERLRRHPWIIDQALVWPSETGLRSLDRPSAGGIVFAPVTAGATPQRFAHMDEAGRLGPLFSHGPVLGDAAPNDAPLSDYVRDPAAIYAQSFAIIRAEADLARFAGSMEDVAIRVIHACGMPEVAADLAFSPEVAEAGRAALQAGKPVLVDVQMVAHGIIRARLPADNAVICTLNDPRTAILAAELGTTRSAAAVELWREHLDGAVVAIGNAPTALFHLLEMIRAGAPRPAAILGFPVGFVGAAESKEALIAANLPHIALRGRRGGSAMAAAAVNALAKDNA